MLEMRGITKTFPGVKALTDVDFDVRPGEVHALGVDPPRMGETVFKTLQKVLGGEKVPPIILTPSVVVTPDNLPDYLAGKLWTEPVAGQPELDNDKPTVP